jgi:hypothetical protein
MDEVDVSFENWAHAGLIEYPGVYEENPGRVYIRGYEMRRKLAEAYRAGWQAREETGGYAGSEGGTHR